MKFVRRSFIWP